MARLKQISIKDIIKNKRKDIQQKYKKDGQFNCGRYIPSIVQFIQGQQYLNLSPDEGIYPYPAQMLMLKVFYRGSPGNENLKLTDDQIEMIRQMQLTCPQNGNVLSKYQSQNLFRQLVLVFGRRSGKDFCASIIALYQACRLLQVSDGDPYSYYKLPVGNEISILTIAGSAGQAGVAFNQIKGKFFSCKYFHNKYITDGIQQSAIYILTQQDKKQNEEMQRNGLPLKKGSICIQVGHSNSASLRGKQIYVCILDEVAFYKQSGGASSGDQIYQGLKPAVDTFVRRIPVYNPDGSIKYDGNGKQITKGKFQGKIVAISSPSGQDGLLWDLFSKADSVPHRVAFRLATWQVNIKFTKQQLRKQNPDRSEDQFNMEFGAQFSGTAGNNFFSREMVQNSFNPAYKLQQKGKPGFVYFTHLDPATTTHNYGLVSVHKQMYQNDKKQIDFKIIVDHIKFWHPQTGKPVLVSQVDNYVLSLKNKFFMAKLTYDQHRSQGSIKTMKENNIPASETRFYKKFKMKIYQQLYNQMNEGRIIIPDDGSEQCNLLKNQMFNIQRKDGWQGWSIHANKNCQVKTDDLIDCLAGAVYQCVNSIQQSYPKSQTVNFNPNSNLKQHIWQGMQGPMGKTGQINQMQLRNMK